jgi:hypothetical protein
LGATAGSLLLLIAVYAWPFAYVSVFVCRDCGRIMHTSAHQIPFTEFAFFTRQDISSSPMSEALRTNAAVGEHQHQWVFTGGSGNGVLCRLAHDRQLGIVANNDIYAHGISALMAELNGSQRTELAHAVLSPESAEDTLMLFMQNDLPMESDKHADEMKDWVAHHQDLLAKLLP